MLEQWYCESFKNVGRCGPEGRSLYQDTEWRWQRHRTLANIASNRCHASRHSPIWVPPTSPLCAAMMHVFAKSNPYDFNVFQPSFQYLHYCVASPVPSKLNRHLSSVILFSHRCTCFLTSPAICHDIHQQSNAMQSLSIWRKTFELGLNEQLGGASALPLIS